MSDRDTILNAIRAVKLDQLPYPDTTINAIAFDDLLSAFSGTLEACGGSIETLVDTNSIQGIISKRYPNCKSIYSQVDTVESIAPESGESIDLAVFNGQFSVAENAAIWLDINNIDIQKNLFLCEHLMITLNKNDVVATMHDAYAKLPKPMPAFGCFVSGPSKTADIEQTLVIGAQAARSLTVILK